MSDQRTDTELLHALIDGELPAAERGQVMATIQDNPNAALDYASFASLKNATSSLPSPQFPDGAWRSCVRRLDEIDRTRRTERFVSRYAWGLCGAFFLLIAGAGTINRLHGQRFDSNEMSHIASSLIPTSKTSDTSNVGKWLQDKVGSAPVQHLDGLTALRAEAGAVDGRQVVRVGLRDSTGLMTLYVVQGDEALDDLPQVPNSNLHIFSFGNGNCVAWSADGFTMLLSGQRDADSLAHVAGAISFHHNPIPGT